MCYNFNDIDIDKYNSIDIQFSKEEKENLKKNLKKKIFKRRKKKSCLVATIALILASMILISNGNNALANVLPTFNKVYEALGFKSEYVSQSVYIGKTYEENGIKITLDNLVGIQNIIKVSLKVQYSDKWPKENRPLVHFAYGFEGKLDTGSFGGSRNIDENTELGVINFTSEEDFPSKGNFQIKAISDAFKNPVVWDMKVDFSRNFKDTIKRKVCKMSNDLGVKINDIEINRLGIITSSNIILSGPENGDNYYFKVGNKIYPVFGACSYNKGVCHTLLENISYDSIINSKNISLIKHSINPSEKIDIKEMTMEEKEESIKYYDEREKQLNALPKKETNGVIYTNKITFKNANKAEIYNVEKKDGKIRLYIKGNDKKQIFNMILNLSTSAGGLVDSLEEIDNGYIAEYNCASKEKILIDMNVDILDCRGNYIEKESKITLE